MCMHKPNPKHARLTKLLSEFKQAVGHDTKLHEVHQSAPTAKRDARQHAFCHHEELKQLSPEEREANTLRPEFAVAPTGNPVIGAHLQNNITEGEAVKILRVLTGMDKPSLVVKLNKLKRKTAASIKAKSAGRKLVRKAKACKVALAKSLRVGSMDEEVIRGRSTHGRDIDRAMQFLERFYSQFNFQVRRVPYKKNGKTFYNLEITIAGTGPNANEVIILGAHLDSTAGAPWGPEDKAPGADDDGSGTTALMLMARFFHNLLKDGTLNRTIRLVHFTGEEQGLWGSNAYSDDVNREVQQGKIKVLYMIAMDMIGYTGQGGNDVEIHDFDDTDRGSRQISERCVYMVKAYELLLNATIQKSDHLADRSDQSGFRRHGNRALLISERTVEENPNYHSTHDVLSTLNIKFLVNVARMVAATTADFAGFQSKKAKAKAA